MDMYDRLEARGARMLEEISDIGKKMRSLPDGDPEKVRLDALHISLQADYWNLQRELREL